MININLEKIRKKRMLLEKQLENMVAKESDYQKIVRENRKIEDEVYLKSNEEKIREIEETLKKLQKEVEKDRHIVSLKEERKNILKKSIKNNGKKNEQRTEIFYSKYCQKYPDDLCEKLLKLIDNIPSKYEKIMKVVLRENLYSIVVRDISSALNIINSSLEKDLDILKIIPLDLIKNIKTLTDDQVKIHNKSVCGFAHELINYSPKYSFVGQCTDS